MPAVCCVHQTDDCYTLTVKVIGYTRVSTSEQADSGLGLDAQRQSIEDACRSREWHIQQLIEDAGVSAKSLDRPGLNDALAALEAGEAEALVVAKVDRLSRSVLGFATLMERFRKREWALVALDIGVDTSTPAGSLIANTMANFAEFERQVIGQRTREALAVKRSAGVRLGRPRSLPDAVVAEILRRREGGESFRAIADDLNARAIPTAQGGRQWHPATVRSVVLSRGDR
jgi:DNA invertase Pin-like site-specific DNA recombinase